MTEPEKLPPDHTEGDPNCPSHPQWVRRRRWVKIGCTIAVLKMAIPAIVVLYRVIAIGDLTAAPALFNLMYLGFSELAVFLGFYKAEALIRQHNANKAS